MSGTTASSQTDVGESLHKKMKMSTILAFAVVIIGLGIPIWWKTTTTYRVALPYNRIDQLSSDKWIFSTQVTILLPERQKEDLDTIQRLLNINAVDGNDSIDSIEPKVFYSVKHWSAAESNLMHKSSSVDEVSEKLFQGGHLSRSNEITGFVLPRQHSLLSSNWTTYVSRHRLFFVEEKSELSHLVSEVKQLVDNVFVRRDTLQQTFLNVKDPQKIKPEKSALWSLRSTPECDITFSLIVPQPDFVRAEWNIQRSIRTYLQPLLDKLTSIITFNIQSQVLYFLSLGIKPLHDTTNNWHYLTYEQLPHIINPLESKLGSHVSTHPTLNFLVYVPAENESPLHIFDEKGTRSATNAFTSPRWGGIFIHNVESPEGLHGNVSKPWRVGLDERRMLEIFISELRTFLGFRNHISGDKTRFQDLDESCLRDWEVDHLLQRQTLENLATATNTLKSLSSLLEGIGNIVINDHVGQLVFDAVEAIEKSEHYLERKLTQEAFAFSKDAYLASEKAFFDPSMLALLYFPEDQKYAVYVPLFLPVSVPVLFSLIQILRIWTQLNGKEKRE